MPDFFNKQAKNMVLHNIDGSIVDGDDLPLRRGLPRVGKIVECVVSGGGMTAGSSYKCTSIEPFPKRFGGGTWELFGGGPGLEYLSLIGMGNVGQDNSLVGVPSSSTFDLGYAVLSPLYSSTMLHVSHKTVVAASSGAVAGNALFFALVTSIGTYTIDWIGHFATASGERLPGSIGPAYILDASTGVEYLGQFFIENVSGVAYGRFLFHPSNDPFVDIPTFRLAAGDIVEFSFQMLVDLF